MNKDKTTPVEHVYIKIEDYIFILDDDTCVEQKSRTAESSHTRRGSSGVGRASEQLTIAKIRELI